MSIWEIPLGLLVGIGILGFLGWLENAIHWRIWPFSDEGRSS